MAGGLASGSLVKLMYEGRLDDLGSLDGGSSSWWRRRHRHGVALRLSLSSSMAVIVSHGLRGTIRISVGTLGGGSRSRGVGGSGNLHGIALWRARHLDCRGEDGHGARRHRVVLPMALAQGHPVWASLHHLSHLRSQRGKAVSMGPRTWLTGAGDDGGIGNLAVAVEVAVGHSQATRGLRTASGCVEGGGWRAASRRA